MLYICYLIKFIHICYILFTYGIIPFVFGSVKILQLINIINISFLIIHWKLLGNECILDILEKKVCPPVVYNMNNNSFGIDDLTFSNCIQLFLYSAIIISLSTLMYRPIPVNMRIIMLILNLSIVCFIIPLAKIYPR